VSGFEESEEFKAAQAAFEKKQNRPKVRNVIERYIDADDADSVARAIERGDFGYDDAEEMGLNVSKAKKPDADGGDDDDDGGGDDDEEESAPRRRSGYFKAT
jgi:hypothetical protein